MVHRSQLKNAVYNPRHLTAKARDRLKANISKVGLLQGPIWNKRSGNIVGGHQRVAIMDALEGTPDYSLNVDVVDLDEKTEKEQNVFLNNPETQGEYDLDKLESLFGDGISWENAGFSGTEIIALFGALPNQGDVDADMLDRISEDMQKAQELHQKIEDNVVDHDEFYAVFIGGSNHQVDAVIESLGLDNSRWQDLRVVERLRDLCKKLGATDDQIKAAANGVEVDAPADSSKTK